MNNIKVAQVKEIITRLESCIASKTPFSLIRWGDGGIKMMEAILHNDQDQLKHIVEKEGIPKNKMVEVFKLWGYFARQADYIDTPYVYYSGDFWPRQKKKGPITKQTDTKLRNWIDLYNDSEFDNVSFCNPEVNYLLCLKVGNRKNLLNVIKNKKIRIITPFEQLKKTLNGICDVTITPIVKQYENHYDNSFLDVINDIELNANKFDIWLISAGELGRIYTGMIKLYGGRAIDMGFVSEYWIHGDLHERLQLFMKQSSKNPLEFVLTDEGKKYQKGIL